MVQLYVINFMTFQLTDVFRTKWCWTWSVPKITQIS